MTNTEAKQIIANEITAWCNTFADDYITDSILGGDDKELQQALALVGTDFDWSVETTIDTI